MKQTDEGKPVRGTGFLCLGIRVRDLHPRVDGVVDPELGGVSISPEGEVPKAVNTPLAREKAFIFALDTDDLPENLKVKEDPKDSKHYFIEPSKPMKFEFYQQAIQETSERWHLV